MEALVLLFLVGVVFVVVGAIEGMIARRRANELRLRLERVERTLRDLVERRDRGAVAADPVPDETAQPSSSPAATAPDVERPWRAPTWSGRPPWLQDEPRPEAATPPPPPLAEPPAGPPAASEPPAAPVPEATPAVHDAAAPAPEPEAARGAEAVAAAEPRPTAIPPTEAAARSASLDAMEKALGLRWLTWIGTGLLFLGVAFFLKYAYDRDWLGRFFGPRLRIATAATTALVLLACGWRSLRNGLTALGQGLCGGGQAMLYLTVYAAFQPAALVVDVPLIGPTAAFALMALVTAVGLAAAVRLDAIAMAFLAVLGGFATPALVSTGQDARDLLCAYLLLLDLGVLGVASYRQWRALDLLAYAGTALLFGGWWSAWQHAHPQPDATLVWLVTFHLVFLVLPFAQHWRRRTPATVERFGLALANVAVTLAFAASMLRVDAPRLLASGCLAAAMLYTAVGVLSARRCQGDVRTRDGFLAFAVLWLTVGLFFLLPSNGITTAWFGEASALVWLGYRFAHARTRLVGFVVLCVAVLRTLVVHLPHPPREADFLWNDWYGALFVAAAGTGLFAWLHAQKATADAERNLARLAGAAAGLWLGAVSTMEIDRHAAAVPDAWPTLPPTLVIAWLWLATALAFLAWALRWPHRTTLLAGLLPLLAAATAVGAAYDGYAADALPVWNGPCLAGLATIALTLLAAAKAERAGDASLRPTLAGAAQLGLTLLATVETAAYVQRGDAPPAPATLAQSLTWVWIASAALGLALASALQSRRVLTITALPLAAAVVGAFATYGIDLAAHRLVANQRFVAALLASAAVAAMRGPLARLGAAKGAGFAAASALVLALGFGTAESITWSQATSSGAAFTGRLVWLLGATSVLGSAGGLWRARATHNEALGTVALMALVPALVLPLAVFLAEFDTGWMFLNLRAALVAAAALTALAWSRSEARLTGLRRAAFAMALLGVTFEPPVWLLDHVEDPGEARRLARFSITVTWIVTATLLLVSGFRLDRRSWRLTALGLFVLTAAKVLVVDMSGAQQVYRILAFLLVGVVFVGASWAYHRAERRLAAAREHDGQGSGSDGPEAG